MGDIATIPPPVVPDVLRATELQAMTLADAASVWLPTRRLFISKKTHYEYTGVLRRLRKEAIGSIVVGNLTMEDIRAYQSTRLSSGSAGPPIINHECSVIQQILKRAGTWARNFQFDYEPLPLRRTKVGRALTDDERERLMSIAASKPEWEPLYLFLVLSHNSTLGPGEAVALRRKDIDLKAEILHVGEEGAKNAYRVRAIPMNAVLKDVLIRTLQVAERKGSVLPEHYIFPFRVSGNWHCGKYDPTRHQMSFTATWNRLRIAAGLEHFRLYDASRHTAITALYENPNIAPETVEQLAGHNASMQMRKRYAHVQLKAKREALARLVPAQPVVASEIPKPEPTPTPVRTGKPLTNGDVREMLEMGLDAVVIIGLIRRCQPHFDISTAALRELKHAGATTELFVAIVESQQ